MTKYRVMMLKDGVWLSSGLPTTSSVEIADQQIQYLWGIGGTFQFKVQKLYV